MAVSREWGVGREKIGILSPRDSLLPSLRESRPARQGTFSDANRVRQSEVEENAAPAGGKAHFFLLAQKETVLDAKEKGPARSEHLNVVGGAVETCIGPRPDPPLRREIHPCFQQKSPADSALGSRYL